MRILLILTFLFIAAFDLSLSENISSSDGLSISALHLALSHSDFPDSQDDDSSQCENDCTDLFVDTEVEFINLGKLKRPIPSAISLSSSAIFARKRPPKTNA